MTYPKPLADISELNRPFWDPLCQHEFPVPKSAGCGDYDWIPYPACRGGHYKLAQEPRSLIVTGNLIGIDPSEVSTGMPLTIAYEEDIILYRFAPAIRAGLTRLQPGDAR
jgi:uncharacterized protein